LSCAVHHRLANCNAPISVFCLFSAFLDTRLFVLSQCSLFF
jgi:hypothetical protein